MAIRLDLYLRELRDLPGDVALGWREQGLRGVGSELRRLTVGQVGWSNQYLVLEQPLDELREARPPPGILLGAIEDGDWSQLDRIAPARALRAFRTRAERGGRTCIAAWRDGRAVGYTWVSERMDTDIERLPLPLPGDAVYGWHLHVAPRERGAGIGAALTHARHLHARARGFHREWRVVRPTNRPAVRSAMRVGSNLLVVGEASLTKRLGGAHATYEPRPPHRADLG